ncbi:hypothetical protein, partial [Pseudomonas syringae]
IPRISVDTKVIRSPFLHTRSPLSFEFSESTGNLVQSCLRLYSYRNGLSSAVDREDDDLKRCSGSRYFLYDASKYGHFHVETGRIGALVVSGMQISMTRK